MRKRRSWPGAWASIDLVAVEGRTWLTDAGAPSEPSGGGTCGSPSYAPFSNRASTSSGRNRGRPSPSGWHTRAATRCIGRSRRGGSGDGGASRGDASGGGDDDRGGGDNRFYRSPKRHAPERALPSRSAASRQMLRPAQTGRPQRTVPTSTKTYEACFSPCPSRGDQPTQFCAGHFEPGLKRTFIGSSRSLSWTSLNEERRPSLGAAHAALILW